MKTKVFIEKVAAWLKKHQLSLLYFLFAVVIEMTAIFAVEGSPFMTRPLLFFGLIVFFFGGLMAIPDNRIRLGVGAVLLVAQMVIDLIFSALFDMTGQTFEFSLLNLRNDAVAALEKIPINFLTFYAGLFCCSIYVIYGLRLIRVEGYGAKPVKKSLFFHIGLSLAGIATLTISFFSYYPGNRDRYKEMIEGKATSAYSSYGMIGNLLGELGTTIRGDNSTMSNEEIEKFIYKDGTASTPTKYFGVSEGKNVVVILAESFEWFAFLKNNGPEAYPNMLDVTEEQLATLYPNLTQFYNESMVMTNFHSREKTDISETMSIMGSYPTKEYISYDYCDNTMPQTVPNILKVTEGDIQARSFHNGYKEFYNRIVTHKAFGFDEGLVDMYDMVDIAEAAAGEDETPTFTNYDERGELNLDTEMIETCKDMMFPTDKRFYTYITTITMHGVYYARDNLASAREEVESVLGASMPDEDDKDANVLLYYLVTAKEFDRAIGIMRSDLEEKGLLDNTVIMLFGDHNAYYQELSNYVKDIDGYNTKNKFTDLYNVPLMIRDSDLLKRVPRQQDRVIDKFTCTADLAPTLLDLLGVKYYTNMFYGHSVFSNEQSVLYSRAYDIFVSDGIVGKSVEKIVFQDESVTKAQLDAYRAEGITLVNKIKHCDYIFRQNYFGTEEKYNLYQQKIQAINS